MPRIAAMMPRQPTRSSPAVVYPCAQADGIGRRLASVVSRQGLAMIPVP